MTRSYCDKLEGEAAAQRVAVRRVQGVKGVTNTIQIKPRGPASEIKRKIEEAFRRSAKIDADRIIVEAHEGEVILKDLVRSWAERHEAERVRQVENRITISV